MNIPNETRWGDVSDSLDGPRLLDPKYHTYHILQIAGMPEFGKEAIVMFNAGARWTESYAAGTHDGIRDGAYTGKIVDMRNNHRGYCSKEQWLKAGNRKFWEKN